MMSYLALYRKYRPADFNSVYGQEEVVTVIKNAIFSNKISHAYLFCGPTLYNSPHTHHTRLQSHI